MARDLVVEPVRHLPARGHVRTARIRRDRESGRDGHAELRHLGEADSLSAEELATARVLVEVEDIAHLREESTGTRQGAESRMVTWSFLPSLLPNAVLVWSRCGLGNVVG